MQGISFMDAADSPSVATFKTCKKFLYLKKQYCLYFNCHTTLTKGENPIRNGTSQ